MTQKELSYIEDAIGHEQNIIKICADIMNSLEDTNLKEFMNQELNSHKEMCNKLINYLEVKTNE